MVFKWLFTFFKSLGGVFPYDHDSDISYSNVIVYVEKSSIILNPGPNVIERVGVFVRGKPFQPILSFAGNVCGLHMKVASLG